MFRLSVLSWVVVTAAAACSSSGGSSDDCAPAGTYRPTATRSADPGTCPADAKLPFTWASITISPGERACGTDKMEISGSTTRSGDYCSYQGRITATASSSGITAKASITLNPCAGSSTSKCLANFDLVYFAGEPDAAPAPDLAQPAPDTSSVEVSGVDSEANPGG